MTAEMRDAYENTDGGLPGDELRHYLLYIGEHSDELF